MARKAKAGTKRKANQKEVEKEIPKQVEQEEAAEEQEIPKEVEEDKEKEEVPEEEQPKNKKQKKDEVVEKKKQPAKGKGKAVATRSTAATTKKERKPRVTKPKPKEEPEYFEDKRNMEDLWTTAFPVGTEWDQIETLYGFKWSFSNLENAFEEGGLLYGKRVYIFGCTEPQLLSVNGEGKLVCIPVIVAIVNDFPPSDKIGINSVQREAEEIIPMKQMKMDWVPYIPLEKRGNQVERLKSDIFIWSCTQRRASLRSLKEDHLKKFEYCLPYFYNPFREEEIDQSTVVDIMFPIEPPVVCDFDWELDDLEEFVDEKVTDEVVTEDQKDAFKEFIREKVKEAKKANREAREARNKAKEETSEETKRAFESMRFYKFYPVKTPDTPDVSEVKAPFINRYYGKAHEVL
ncbi:protein HEAT INTOLERANT 4-like [Papaver somniferum]|uniref:protein HEAT INTOLERANT 4-like n=1 Tax=Papaver somniferum TaxID=3469 RepID=UPI000E6F582C|nr:protein HEAT INTOLERANT 4-like [Papaver somniferum]